MFTLRTISQSQPENNIFLGGLYSYVERFVNQELFPQIFENVFGVPHVPDADENATDTSKQCYGFILTTDMSPIPLFMNDQHYVMSSDGKTFANISFKKHLHLAGK